MGCRGLRDHCPARHGCRADGAPDQRRQGHLLAKHHHSRAPNTVAYADRFAQSCGYRESKSFAEPLAGEESGAQPLPDPLTRVPVS